jgi:hypothetical protein
VLISPDSFESNPVHCELSPPGEVDAKMSVGAPVRIELTSARLPGECSTTPPQVDHFMEDALTVYCPDSSDSSDSLGSEGSLDWSGSLRSQGSSGSLGS